MGADAEKSSVAYLKQIQKVYRAQGIVISDKHIEVIVRQMLKKVYIKDAGDTDMVPGTRVDIEEFTERNADAIFNGKTPAEGQQLILGITKAALETKSFLSAASFQETTRVLTDASIKEKNDALHGLKENVITGKLIPAGTGMKQYRNVEVDYGQNQVLIDEYVRKQELENMHEEKSDYDLKLDEAISTEEIMNSSEVFQDEAQIVDEN